MRVTAAELAMLQGRLKRREKNNDPGRSTDVEQHLIDESQGSDATEKAVSSACISITHYRHRLADIDNYCTKWMVDGIVEAGLLQDDSPKFVAQITHRHVKIPSWDTEHMVIEIDG